MFSLIREVLPFLTYFTHSKTIFPYVMREGSNFSFSYKSVMITVIVLRHHFGYTFYFL